MSTGETQEPFVFVQTHIPPIMTANGNLETLDQYKQRIKPIVAIINFAVGMKTRCPLRQGVLSSSHGGGNILELSKLETPKQIITDDTLEAVHSAATGR
jgi:hypothetical protein